MKKGIRSSLYGSITITFLGMSNPSADPLFVEVGNMRARIEEMSLGLGHYTRRDLEEKNGCCSVIVL